jgi:DNA polymerase-3 subunit alpha
MGRRFVHLHLHSHYSLLDGAIRIPDLTRQVAAMDMPAVALTDHGNLFGAFQFHESAVRAGIRPVVGCEVYVAPGDHRRRKPARGRRKPYDHLVLLAENQRGYRNLVRLVSTGYLEGFYHKPRISKELLNEHGSGLIGLSACLSGEVARHLLARDPEAAQRCAEEYREILGQDSFFLEIQDHGMHDEEFVRDGVAAISSATGIPIVATNDCHFHRREDTFAHKVLLGIGLNRSIDELRRGYSYNEEYYVKSAEEMFRLFEGYPGACERTAEIAARCHVTFNDRGPHLPQYPVPEGHSLTSYLGEVANHGLERRLERPTTRRHDPRDYRARLATELEIIDKMGFPGYFLVVWDFIRFSRERGIPVGPGRGSAAGSVVSWALGITDIDPLEHDLLFERFLNPERISMPDIDIDFCQRRRDEVISYVRDLYGAESVSQIATFNILKAKSAVRDVGRVLGMSFADVDRIAKLIPDELKITVDRALADSPQLKELADGDEEVRQLLDAARRVEGLARHCGVHAAGVVIAPVPLIELLPLYRSSHEEVTTQFDKDEVETLGLLKMDFLGLRTLTVLADAVESIRRTEDPEFDLDAIPFDDESVYQLFSAGDTDGVFQFESSGMKEVLRKVNPRVFADLAALNALYRPGPMSFIDDYSERRHGRRAITYIFPELEEILGETYGVIVYQEQVMRIAVKIAGFSMAKADTLRKAMGKKKQEIIDREGESFIEGGVAHGHPRRKVQQLWDQIVPFAKYGFNKSHSVAYAHVAYQTAFLKVHYPDHFMAAMLTSEATNTDKLSQYLNRCQQMGIVILPPDINTSLPVFTVEPEGIRYGLTAIKGVGLAAVEPILVAREKVGGFESVAHCLRSLPPRAVNHKVMECLAKAGSFDRFGLPRKALLEGLEQLMELAAREREHSALGQGFLFDAMPSEDLEAELASAAEAEVSDRLAWERDVLGFYLSGHPLDGYAEQLARFADCRISQIGDLFSAGAERVTVGGLVTGLKAMAIKKDGRNQGRRMAVFQLEDPTATVRAVAFPDTFERCQHRLVGDSAVLVNATIKGDGDHVELTLEDVASLDDVDSNRASALRIVIDLAEVDRERLEQLRETLLEHPGDLAVRFDLRRRGQFRARLVPPPALAVDASPQLRTSIAAVVGGCRTEFEFDTATADLNGRLASAPARLDDDEPGDPVN